jgi:group II intron reverse transcriptase/maturase
VTGVEPERKGTEEAKTKEKAHSLIKGVFYRKNLIEAFKRVKANAGSEGIDGETVEDFEGNLEGNILRLEREIQEGRYQPQAVRRVWIPKSDGKQRPLGIPAVRDRVVQQSLRMKLEPVFEPHFSETSYGYRPKRSAHQALGDIAMSLSQGGEWIVEADIEGYFDHIDHEKLIDAVALRVADGSALELIRKFLKSGVMEELKVRRTTQGTPQGGVISPLLANIYLDAFDHEMSRGGFRVVRYADDWVIVCKKKTEAVMALGRMKQIIEGKLGLKLHSSKTRIVHITKGFEFLGFLFRRSASLYVIPRPKALCQIREKVRNITRRGNPWSVEEMVKYLNLVLKGWGCYYRKAKVKRIFWRLDKWIARRVWAFMAKRWKNQLYRNYPPGYLRNGLGIISLYGLAKTVS